MSPAALPPELLRERIRWVLFARVVIVTLFLGAWALSLRDVAEAAIAPVEALAAVIVAAYVLSLATVALYSRTNRLRWLSALQVAADIGLITAAIPMTGGLQSPMAVWYNLAIIGAAALLLREGALAAATLSSITYGALMNLLFYGWLPSEVLAWSPPPTNDFGVIYQIGANIASFYSIALLAGVFVERIARTEADLAETRGRLETSEEDLLSVRTGLDRAEAECQRALAEWRRADEAYHRAVAEGQDAQLRLHREQEVVAKSLGSCVLTVGDDGIVQSVVGVAASILRREPSEIVGRSIGDVFPVLRPPLGSVRPLDPGAIPSELAYRAPGKDGDEEVERLFRCRTVRLEDTYGTPLNSTLYIFQDVTRSRDLERKAPEAPTEPEKATPIVDLEGMIGRSPRMQAIDQLVRRVAPTGSTVLVTGESGTGKELVARALHSLSPRRGKPLVVVNCAAIPENLLESELFGHVRGAFTGAVAERRGLLRSADGGTVFLDEIGELPGTLQAKLLRVLQERSFTPVGSTQQVFVDVRIVAATNRDLEAAVAAGKFRDDLYYRLNVIRVGIPPLRERPEDLPVLIDHFLRHFAAELKKPTPTLSPAAERRLLEHPYPGNIRELETVIEHAVALVVGDTIDVSDLPYSVGEAPAVYASKPVEAPVSAPSVAAEPPSDVEAMQAKGSNLDLELETVERRYINQALRLAGGVRKRAAELLGINYRSLRHRLAKYGFEERAEDELQ